jgi:hypothetical protein
MQTSQGSSLAPEGVMLCTQYWVSISSSTQLYY